VPHTVEPFSGMPSCQRLYVRIMAAESNTRKDSLKVEKTSLLLLTLCIVVLVSLLVFRPF
jgi:hypothetical protein